MAITLEQLTQTQKQIQAFFLRPVRLQSQDEVPEWLNVWYKRGLKLADDDQLNYHWGVRFVEGVGVSWPREPRLDVYLTLMPPPKFSFFLSRLFAPVPLRLVVTGQFQFLQG